MTEAENRSERWADQSLRGTRAFRRMARKWRQKFMTRRLARQTPTSGYMTRRGGSRHASPQSQEPTGGLAGHPTENNLYSAQIDEVSSISIKGPPMGLARTSCCTNRKLESTARIGRRTASLCSS